MIRVSAADTAAFSKWLPQWNATEERVTYDGLAFALCVAVNCNETEYSADIVHFFSQWHVLSMASAPAMVAEGLRMLLVDKPQLGCAVMRHWAAQVADAWRPPEAVEMAHVWRLALGLSPVPFVAVPTILWPYATAVRRKQYLRLCRPANCIERAGRIKCGCLCVAKCTKTAAGYVREHFNRDASWLYPILYSAFAEPELLLIQVAELQLWALGGGRNHQMLAMANKLLFRMWKQSSRQHFVSTTAWQAAAAHVAVFGRHKMPHQATFDTDCGYFHSPPIKGCRSKTLHLVDALDEWDNKTRAHLRSQSAKRAIAFAKAAPPLLPGANARVLMACTIRVGVYLPEEICGHIAWLASGAAHPTKTWAAYLEGT